MRKIIAILLSAIISVGVITGIVVSTNKPAEAATTAQDLAVCPLPPLVCVTVTATVRLPGATVTLPRRTVTLLNPVTVRVPPVTVSQIIRVPRVTQTIILPPRTLPGPVRTVVRPGLPGATKTATVVVSKEVIRNGTAPPITREVRTTLPGVGQTSTTSVRLPPGKEVIRIPGTTKTVTKFQALGLSLLALLLLMALGLFLLWLGFVLGYKSSDKENMSFLKSLRDAARRRPGKHE